MATTDAITSSGGRHEHGHKPRNTQPLANRLAACAVGLAFADRDRGAAAGELHDLAGADTAALGAARNRLAALDRLDGPTRARADALLARAMAESTEPTEAHRAGESR